MKTSNFFGTTLTLALALGLLATLGGTAHTLAAVPSPNAPVEETGPVQPKAPQAGPIIIDHTTTNINAIPQQWIEAAKQNLHIGYGHTSHGSQLSDGMSGLIGFANNGGKGLALPVGIFQFAHDGNHGGTYLHLFEGDGYGSGDLDHDAGYYPNWVNETRAYLGTPDVSGRGSNHPEMNVIIWSWCGQASGYTEETMRTAYLDPMSQLEADYPGVKFVYMTGHSDGSGETGNLHLRNQQIRQYAIQNNKILYDFYNIELYDPDGNYFGNKAVNDNCDYDSDGNGSRDKNWCTAWQSSHTQNVDWYSVSCAHSQSLNCNQKAYAVWWLWARLAGWAGPEGKPLSISKSVALTHDPAWPGDPITYTIVLHNSTVTDTTNVHITDTMPSGVFGANVDMTQTVPGNGVFTITVPATVMSNVSSGAVITNTAFYTHATGGDSARAAFRVTTLLPNLSTSAKRVSAASVQAGGLVTFTLVFTNSGQAAASLRYTDTLPAQVTWVSGPLSSTVSVNAGSVVLPTTIVARVKRDLANGTTFSNTVALNDRVHSVFTLASPTVTVLAPDLSNSPRTVNKSVFQPGERITYTLTLSNTGGLGATVRYTVTLPSQAITPSNSSSGTAPVGTGTAALPVVLARQVQEGLATGTTFQARVDINDGYHAVYSLNFPMSAINAFYTYLPVVLKR